MKAADMTMERIEQLIAEHRVSTVIVAATDPAGVVRGKRLTVPYFRKAVEGGVNFSSYILGTTTMDEVLPGLFDTGIPDVRGHIDLGSFRLAPWEDGAAIVLMDWHTEEGEPHPLCPRSALKRQVERAGDMGYAVRASLELEFYLLPIPIREVRQGRWSDLPLPARDIHCYSVLEGHFSEPIIGRLRACFPDEIEACLPEWGQGQFEVNLYRSDALKMADTAVMMKLAPSRSRRRPAPPPPSSPSCARTCPAAPAISTSACAMQGAARACSTTPRARSGCRASSCVVAAIWSVREAALFYAPNVNSYKRMQAGSFAGTTRCWGVDNRTAGFRAINESAARRVWKSARRRRPQPLSRHRRGPRRGAAGIAKGLQPPPPPQATITSRVSRRCRRRGRGGGRHRGRHGDPRDPAAGTGGQCVEDRPVRDRGVPGHRDRPGAPPLHGNRVRPRR